MQGLPEVDKYMQPVAAAISRHLEWQSRGATDIYNRAYEAVQRAIKDKPLLPGQLPPEVMEICRDVARERADR